MSFFRAVGGLVADCFNSVVASSSPENQLREKLGSFITAFPLDSSSADNFCGWLIAEFIEPVNDPATKFIPGHTKQINNEKLQLLKRIIQTNRPHAERIIENFHRISAVLNTIYEQASPLFTFYSSIVPSRITSDDMTKMKDYVARYHDLMRLLNILIEICVAAPKAIAHHQNVLNELDDFKKNFEEIDLFKKISKHVLEEARKEIDFYPGDDELNKPASLTEYMTNPCGIYYFDGQPANSPSNSSPSLPSSPNVSRSGSPNASHLTKIGQVASASNIVGSKSPPIPAPPQDYSDIATILREKGYKITWIDPRKESDAVILQDFCKLVGLGTAQKMFDNGVFNKALLQDYLVNFLNEFSLEKFQVTRITPPPAPRTAFQVLQDMVVYKKH